MHGVARLVCVALLWQYCAPCLFAEENPKVASRNAMEQELESIAIIERKVMVPMRDGKRMQADIYRPKDESKKYPILFSRGTAYNIDDNIQRVRYREGYDKPPVWMEKDKVYKVTLQPMQTSNYFAPGHQLRIEVSSSNFPRFDRNLNTGGNNFDESQGVIAHNAIHHSAQYPSSVTLSVR